jgi:hypothetical protein
LKSFEIFESCKMALFGKLFGKRFRKPATAVPPSPIRANEERRYIFPTELWDDSKHGKFFQEIGFHSPDDPRNFFPTEEERVARVKAAEAAMHSKMEEYKHTLYATKGAGEIKPFFLLGDACWSGETGSFLLNSLNLLPYEEWNIAYLAADEKSARLFKIPMHPGRIPDLETWGCQLIMEIKQRVDGLSGGANIYEKNLADIKAHQAALPGALQDVRAVAKHFHTKLSEILPSDFGVD